MQKQKIDKTYRFSLLMLLKMLNKARKPLNFRTVGKRSKSVCAKTQTKQYGSKAVRHSANIGKKSQLTKHSTFQIQVSIPNVGVFRKQKGLPLRNKDSHRNNVLIMLSTPIGEPSSFAKYLWK